MKGWIGRLKRDTRVRGGPRVVGGMRLLRKGRLICDGEYFGHHDFRYKASLGMLIGEVELTTKFPVLPNKTDFDRDSVKWEEAQRILYDTLKPHIEELLEQKEEETVTREERKRVSQVRTMMIEAFKLLSKYSDLPSRFGGDRGRKKPERRPEEQKQIKDEHSRLPGEYEPRTPPPENAVGRLQRLSRMPEWEVRLLGPNIRSEWGEKSGRQCLIINKNFSLYEERRGDELYIAETAILQLAKPQENEKLTLDEYIEEVNVLMRAFCEVLHSAL